MDIARPHIAKRKRRRRILFAAGGVLALIVIALRAFGWSEGLRQRVVLLRPKAGIPYGVAIAAGALIAMALQR